LLPGVGQALPAAHARRDKRADRDATCRVRACRLAPGLLAEPKPLGSAMLPLSLSEAGSSTRSRERGSLQDAG